MADTKKNKTKATSKAASKSKSEAGGAKVSKAGDKAKPALTLSSNSANGKDAQQHGLQPKQAGGDEALFSRMQVLAQYLKDLSFESPNAPQIFTPQQGQVPQFSLDIRVKADKLAPERHEVTLILKVAMTRGEQACFLIEIVYAGLVAVQEPVPEESLLQALLLIEVPRLLFPYARNILSELTQSSGFPPLVVQPVDFAALYRKQLAEARASAS